MARAFTKRSSIFFCSGALTSIGPSQTGVSGRFGEPPLAFHSCQRNRRVSLHFSGEAIRHVSQEQDPKRKRESEQWKLERERQRIDNGHQRNPNGPSRKQCRKYFVAIMPPGEKIAQRLH